MATMQDFLDQMAAPVGHQDGISAVRLALNNPDAWSAADVANVERTARSLNLNYGMADAGGQDAALEAKAREIEQNPVADAWTAKAEENIAFLAEDRQALGEVYDTLVSTGVLSEQDISREQVMGSSGAGDSVRNAWERGRLQNLISGYGLMFQRGEYENLDELRQKIREAKAALQALQGDDPLGIYGAIEQLPRMLGWDMPMQAAWAAAGATAGGIAGSFIPGAGTVAGAGAGGVAGGIAGTLYSAWHSEEGAMAADLLLEMDDAGNFLDEQAVRQAATLYGGLSGAVEAGGEALFLKYIGAPVLKSVKGALDKHLVRDAVREAAGNKSLGRVFRSFGLGALKSGAIEGGQEAVQEGISAQIEATAKNWLSDTGRNYYREHQAGALSSEGMRRMAEAGWEAFKTGPWFYALPGGLKLTLDTRAALRARDFADAHKQIADKVAETKTRELSPARMESYLQTAGLDGDVLIPADAALQLQQQGVDLAGPLGWEMRDLEEAAALGHDIVMPAARVQSLLQPDAMKAVADIMREAPQAMSAVEAAELNDNLPADMDGLIEQAEEDSLERSAIEGELTRLREEMTQAVKSAPHLMGQITSSMDPDTSVGQFVDNHLAEIMRFALGQNRLGIPVSDVLSRFTFQGLVQDDRGRLVTPEEAEEFVLRQAEEDALAPFWDTVWGRLDADSLLSDFPDARRELAFQHGRGLFAKRGEGVAVDELADELREMGLLDPDADSSTLVERLKELRRPERSRARARQGMLQHKNGIQIDGSMLGVPEGSDIREYIKAAKKYHDQLKKESENGKPVIQPQLNKPVRFSSKGWRKNQSAGANPDKWKLFPKLREIIENSTLIHTEEVSKSRRDKFIRFHWLECQVNFEGKPRLVGLTLAEDSDGNLFYNLNADVGAWQKNNDSSNLPAQSMAGESESLYQDASASNVSNIRTKPDGVNLHILPQGPHDTALGSTTLTDDGRYVVQLFRGANLSTLTHETAHVFFLEMERLEREGLADERMLADLAALREWTARMDDEAALKEEYDRYQKHGLYGGADFARLSDFQKAEARSRAKQEMLARGFEQYLREGKAPSRKLESVFTRFRTWLMRVYRDALDLHVELTDEVRDVFDRMLAHEEEMDLKAEAAEVKDETARLLDALELKGAKRLEIEGLIHQAKSEAAEKLRHVRDEKRQTMRRAWAKEAQEQMESERVYVARKAIRRTPIDLASFSDVNGEELGAALTKKLPGSTRKQGGMEAEVLAAELGYESAAAMARDIIDSPTPGQRVKQLIDQRQAEHDALFDADDFLFEQEQLAERRKRSRPRWRRKSGASRRSSAIAVRWKAGLWAGRKSRPRWKIMRTLATCPAGGCSATSLGRRHGPCWTKSPWARRCCRSSSAGLPATGCRKSAGSFCAGTLQRRWKPITGRGSISNWPGRPPNGATWCRS